MNRNERITALVAAIEAAGSLSLHVIVANVFADYAPAAAVDGALSTLRAAEARGLIRRTNKQYVGTFHDVYAVA